MYYEFTTILEGPWGINTPWHAMIHKIFPSFRKKLEHWLNFKVTERQKFTLFPNINYMYTRARCLLLLYTVITCSIEWFIMGFGFWRGFLLFIFRIQFSRLTIRAVIWPAYVGLCKYYIKLLKVSFVVSTCKPCMHIRLSIFEYIYCKFVA